MRKTIPLLPIVFLILSLLTLGVAPVSAGTPVHLLKDIVPGPTGSKPGEITRVGDLLYFGAHDGTSGRELWRSDGTEEGTVTGGPMGQRAPSW